MAEARRKRFVVVGCGASACALVAKLCESRAVEVVVLEQGSVKWPMLEAVKDAALWARAATHKDTHYLLTAPQEHLLERQIRLPLGSGIGGSTNVNAMLCGLGHRKVFDEHWPSGFDADTMERAAKEVTEMLGASSTRSEMIAHESQKQALKGSKQGTTLWEDGAVRSTYLATMKDGQRLTMQELLFKLVVKHRNLRIVMNARVQEVLFQDTVAVGVRYRDTQTGATHEVHTARGGEVILCAGALNTPCLLLQSRLGMQRMLRRLHNKRVTPVVKSFPDVGKRILDHTVTPMVLLGFWKPSQHSITTASSAGAAGEPANSIHGYIYLTADGKLCSNPDDIPRTQLVFFDGRIGPHILAEMVLPRWSGNRLWMAIYGLLYHLLSLLAGLPLVQWLCSFVYGCLICNVQPRSEGFVMFESNQPTGAESVAVHAIPDMKYNSDPSDREALWRAYQAARQFFNGSAIGATGAAGSLPRTPCKPLLELLPGPFGRSASLFDLYARWLTMTYFHYAGTCRMGHDASDPHAVVDTSFRVKHVHNLRVCDASVIPHLPSFPIAATCFALGNLLGEKLLATPLGSVAKKASTQCQELDSE